MQKSASFFYTHTALIESDSYGAVLREQILEIQLLRNNNAPQPSPTILSANISNSVIKQTHNALAFT